MQGPFPPGTHSRISEITAWESSKLARGKRYRVQKPFTDANGDLHATGESWQFIASMFSPLDDELLIAVRRDDATEWRILLRWLPDAEPAVIEKFADYVVPG